MTTFHAGARERLRMRLWARVLAWAVRPDNAKTDFAIIGLFNTAVGVVLAAAPSVAHSPSLAVLMALAGRAVWATGFLCAGVLVLAALRIGEDRRGDKVRHYAWMCSGTLLVMWLVGVLESTGSLTSVLVLAALLAWYTLTAARLELPRALRR